MSERPGQEKWRQSVGRREYLLAELRCAALRARIWQADIEAVGLALRDGLIAPEQAIALLDDCDCLQLVGIREETAA
jgi:hypothetical protein